MTGPIRILLETRNSETQSRLRWVQSRTLPRGALLCHWLAGSAFSVAALYSAVVKAQWKYTTPHDTRRIESSTITGRCGSQCQGFCWMLPQSEAFSWSAHFCLAPAQQTKQQGCSHVGGKKNFVCRKRFYDTINTLEWQHAFHGSFHSGLFLHLHRHKKKIRLKTEAEDQKTSSHRHKRFDWSLCSPWNSFLPPPAASWRGGSLNPSATSANCVSRFEGCGERPPFAEEARLALISHGVWDAHGDLGGGKESWRFSRCSARDTAESIVGLLSYTHPKDKTANCRVRNFDPNARYNAESLSIIGPSDIRNVMRLSDDEAFDLKDECVIFWRSINGSKPSLNTACALLYIHNFIFHKWRDISVRLLCNVCASLYREKKTHLTQTARKGQSFKITSRSHTSLGWISSSVQKTFTQR